MNYIAAAIAILGAAIGAGYGNGQVISKTIESWHANLKCQVNYVQRCSSG